MAASRDRARPRSSRLAALLALAGLAGLAACAQPPAGVDVSGDARPHPGVARARLLPVHGVDVSRWQGSIDWVALRQGGARFAFIKATEGGDHIDPRFREHWEGARAAGVPRGAYHFVYWCRPAIEQAAWFERHLPRDPDALPPVLDLEWNGHSKTCPRTLPREQAREKVRVMLDALERHTGKRPIIYTDITFHRDVLAGAFDDYSYWLRSTAAEPAERYERDHWTFWQYTTTGRVPGVTGAVDRNAFHGTEAQWSRFTRTGCDPKLADRLAPLGLCRDS